MKTVDYLLVGQGMAGTFLAKTLEKQGATFHIIDNHHHGCASKVAAGIYNPMVFRRLLPAWMADVFLPKAISFFRSEETIYNTSLIKPYLLYKILNEQDEQFWRLKAGEHPANLFCNAEPSRLLSEGLAHGDGYYGVVNNCGTIDLNTWLDLARKEFKNKGVLSTGEISDENIDQLLSSKSIDGEIQFKKLIFCNGYQSTKLSLLSGLKFRLTKGEVLTIKAPTLQLQKLIKKNVFVLPVGEDLYKVGATFNWQFDHTDPTEEGKIELTEKLSQLIDVEYTIVDHQAGVRPTTHDRRPYLGKLPDREDIYVFNGLGSRGALAGPSLAEHFVDYLLKGVSLWEEVDIERMFRKKVRARNK